MSDNLLLQKTLNAIWFTIQLWAALGVIFGVLILCITPDQITSRQDFISQWMNPAITFVQQYEKTNNSLPTESIMQEWDKDHSNAAHLIYSSSEIPDELHNRVKEIPNGEWVLEVFGSESFVYYIPWLNTFVPNNFGWLESIKLSLLFTLIGVTPLGLVFTVKKVMKKLRQYTKDSRSKGEHIA